MSPPQLLLGRQISPPASFIDRLRRNEFARNVAVLASGTAIAQCITVISTPVLTRLYAPAEYGVLALFMAIVTSVTPAICGRFELTVVVAKSETHARQLLAIALIVASFLSAASLVIILIFWNPLVALLDASRLGLWLTLAPIAIFLNGNIQSLKYYANRLREYTVISKSTLLQAIVGVVATIAFGVLEFGVNGLLLGAFLGLSSTALWLNVRYRKDICRQGLVLGRRTLLLIQKYRDFPIYNATTTLLSAIHLALPVFFLTHYFTEAIVGYYGLILQVAQAPLSFLSSAVSRVHLKKVADLVHQNAPVRPYLARLSLGLTALATPFALLLVAIAPGLFASLFGEGWRDAGVYMQILIPGFALRFVVSTVSTALAATGNNRLGAVWKVTAFITTATMLSVLAPTLGVEALFWAIMITDVALYLLYFAVIWHASGHPATYSCASEYSHP